MNNVINLPGKRRKEKTKEARGILLSLLIVCFIVVAVMMNDSLLKDEHPIYLVSDNPINAGEVTRSIASAQPTTSLFQNIEWEHKLIQKLNENFLFEKNHLVVGSAASFNDQLHYGVLAGKYRVEWIGNDTKLISHIEYIDTNDITRKPILLERESFLKDFKNLFMVPFENIKSVRVNEGADRKGVGKEEYHLLDSKKNIVGKVSFEMDEEGRFISMSISKID